MKFPKSCSEVQAEHIEWLAINYPNAEPWRYILGAIEELGELAHAFGKTDDWRRREVDIRDAVGDTCIFLMGLCSHYGWSFEEVVSETWGTVRERKR